MDLKELHQNPDAWQILDVREPYEWAAGHIERAIHVPLGELMAGGEGGRLDPGKPVAVICRSGNRSELGALMLQARGFEAQNVSGGMEEWAKLGLPFESDEGGPGKVA
jgi:rhodanese-related sulfurtransferase